MRAEDALNGRPVMKVFVAGATGAVGKQLVPQFIKGGYEVIALTRSARQ